MTDKEATPKASVPEGIATSVAALEAESRALAQAASRGWKITAVFFIVLLVVIVVYLSVLKATLTKYAQPKYIVELGLDRVDDALASAGMPGVRSGQLPDWAAKELKDRAPAIVQGTLRPRLEEAMQRLPETREELVQKFTDNAPEYVDRAADWLTQRALPQATKTLRNRLLEEANKAMDQVGDQLGEMVAGVIALHKADLAALQEQDWPRVRQAMEQELEAQLGPTLDTVFEAVDEGITTTEEGIDELLWAYRQDALNDEQKLELQLIRLLRALFEQKALAFEQPALSIFEQAAQELAPLTEAEIAGLPEPTEQGIPWGRIPEQARVQIRQALEQAPQGPATMIPWDRIPPDVQRIIRGGPAVMPSEPQPETAPAAPPAGGGMPEEARRAMEEAIRRGQQMAPEAAPTAPVEPQAGTTPAAPPVGGGMPEEARRAMEEAIRRGQQMTPETAPAAPAEPQAGTTTAAPPAGGGMPEEARRAMEEAIRRGQQTAPEAAPTAPVEPQAGTTPAAPPVGGGMPEEARRAMEEAIRRGQEQAAPTPETAPAAPAEPQAGTAPAAPPAGGGMPEEARRAMEEAIRRGQEQAPQAAQ